MLVEITYDGNYISPSNVSANIEYELEGGLALFGLDYTLSKGASLINLGTRKLSIPVVSDNVPEMDENLQVRLLSTDQGTIVRSIGEVVIVNDDVPDALEELTGVGTPTFAIVPDGSVTEEGWMGTDYDHTTWKSGRLAAGYKSSGVSSYTPLIGLDVAEMKDITSSVYLRVPFDTSAWPHIDHYSFAMQYDDGFVAYLNGQEIARSFAPSTLSWNSSATGYATADKPYAFNVPELESLIKNGENVFAIHGLNQNAGSSDLLMIPVLRGWSTFGRLYSEWISGYSGVDTSNYYAGADIDGDSIPNGVEWAFRLDPTVAENRPLPAYHFAEDFVEVIFDAPASLPVGVSVEIQISEAGGKGSWISVARKLGASSWSGSASITESPVDAEKISIIVRIPIETDSLMIRLAALIDY